MPEKNVAEGGTDNRTAREAETALEQEVPDGNADRQHNEREQGELGGFWLNHGDSLRHWCGFANRIITLDIG